MTNWEKRELRQLAKEGYSFSEIRSFVSCSDVTIKNYLKIFNPKKAVKETCKILAKDDKALTELAEAYLAIPEEPKKKRGRPKKENK